MVLTHKNVYEREAFAGYEDAREKTEDKSSTSNGDVTISFPDSSSDSGTASHLAPSFPSPNEKEGLVHEEKGVEARSMNIYSAILLFIITTVVSLVNCWLD